MTIRIPANMWIFDLLITIRLTHLYSQNQEDSEYKE